MIAITAVHLPQHYNCKISGLELSLQHLQARPGQSVTSQLIAVITDHITNQQLSSKYINSRSVILHTFY